MTAPVVVRSDRPPGAVDGSVPRWQVVSVPTPPEAERPDDASVRRARADVLLAEDPAPPAWTPGERLHDLYERSCLRMGRRAARQRLAVDYGEVAFTYAELGELANRLANLFLEVGVRAGDRVGLLLDRTIGSHASVLALSRVGATWVPLDAGFPDDRIAYMLDDACVTTVVTLTRFASRFVDHPVEVIELDAIQHLIAAQPSSPPPTALAGGTGRLDVADDPICYIIYTSGSTGRPKGVPVRHSSICNFVAVAAAAYGYQPGDRVYQGMTIAFDFSVEELWVPLAVGATLVPAPGEVHLVGDDLADFLIERRITALCCVPTLLATLDGVLPSLRLLLVSGEACPPDVIDPWLGDGRRVLNAYGPTETTVTATWSVMAAGRAVTIGGPLPSYSVVILDPDSGEPVPAGEIGEIAVGGPGVAVGYLDQPERTAQSFVPDTIGLPDNPSGRIYRTGDLGRITAENEIEFLGRIDTQVKIRGYRIELDEIAAIARSADGVGHAVVETWRPEGGDSLELVAYLTRAEPDRPIEVDAVHEAIATDLPPYMVPAWYEELDELPLLPSTKVDRRALPAPTGARYQAGGGIAVAPRTEAEAEVARLLADVLGVETVSVEADFFDDLGADSLHLAELATALRSELGVKRLSMRKLYENSSVASVAVLVDPQSPPIGGPQEPEPAASVVDEAVSTIGPVADVDAADVDAEGNVAEDLIVGSDRAVPVDAEPARQSISRMATGAAQLAAFVLTTFVAAIAVAASVRWVGGANGLLEVYGRAVLAGSALYLGTGFGLVAVKWLAVGRFRAEPVPLWSPAHVRFWVARSAIRINPFNVLVGTPAYNAYLRLLGVRVGPGAVILVAPPTCTDLVSIGARTVIREECLLPGYIARPGSLQPGSITIGDDVVIGDASVLEIDTEIGVGARVGNASCVPSGHRVDPWTVVQGSPVQPFATVAATDRVGFRPLDPGDRWRRRWFTATQLAGLALVSTPIGIVAAVLIGSVGFSVGQATPVGGQLGGVIDLLVAGGAVYLGGIVSAAFVTLAIPRVLHRFVRHGVAHPLYGTQWRLARAVQRYSNNLLLNTIFGDSSMIVGYLKAVGYDLSKSTQTGSNFGVDQRHHNPFMVAFGRNTLVSDGLRLLNMEISATSFELRSIVMPPDTYLGNDVRYPAGARVGAGCLIATKAAVPIDGPIREGVGILGSPAFEIPRSVARDLRFDHYKQPGVLEKRLRLKLRSNLVTLGLYLARSWFLIVWSMALTLGSFGIVSSGGQDLVGAAAALTLAATMTLWSGAVLAIVIERLVSGFRPLQPLYCSLYDERFWAHERFWKLNYNAFLRAFDGTPFKPVLLRLQGVTVGRRVFDDGGGLTEPTLVELGDGVVLNQGSTIQCHSLEDGTFKSDRTRVGAGATLGVGAFIHYGVEIHQAAAVEADSFVMKGSNVPAQATWRGNPARDVESDRPTANGTLADSPAAQGPAAEGPAADRAVPSGLVADGTATGQDSMVTTPRYEGARG